MASSTGRALVIFNHKAPRMLALLRRSRLRRVLCLSFRSVIRILADGDCGFLIIVRIICSLQVHLR
jgi:hypothetical protein